MPFYYSVTRTHSPTFPLFRPLRRHQYQWDEGEVQQYNSFSEQTTHKMKSDVFFIFICRGFYSSHYFSFIFISRVFTLIDFFPLIRQCIALFYSINSLRSVCSFYFIIFALGFCFLRSFEHSAKFAWVLFFGRAFFLFIFLSAAWQPLHPKCIHMGKI